MHDFSLLIIVTKNYAIEKPFHLNFITKYITYYELHICIEPGQSSCCLSKTIKFQLLFSVYLFFYYEKNSCKYDLKFFFLYNRNELYLTDDFV